MFQKLNWLGFGRKDSKTKSNESAKQKNITKKSSSPGPKRIIKAEQSSHIGRYRKACTDDLYDYMVKLIVIGDSGVGKTNLISRFCEGDNINYRFKDTHNATIGVDFSVKIINVDGKRIKLQIWDTAGQERFRNLTETYYKGAAGIMLMYSVDSQTSFKNIENWIEQVNYKTNKGVKKILIANKIDVRKGQKDNQEAQSEEMKGETIINSERGKHKAKDFNLQYFQSSAKQNVGVDQIFYSIAQLIKQKIDQQQKREIESNYENSGNKTISLDKRDHVENIHKEEDGVQFHYKVRCERAPPEKKCAC